MQIVERTPIPRKQLKEIYEQSESILIRCAASSQQVDLPKFFLVLIQESDLSDIVAAEYCPFYRSNEGILEISVRPTDRFSQITNGSNIIDYLINDPIPIQPIYCERLTAFQLLCDAQTTNAQVTHPTPSLMQITKKNKTINVNFPLLTYPHHICPPL